MKNKVHYVCRECGAVSSQWKGQCLDCGGWNSLVEELMVLGKRTNSGYAGEASKITLLQEINTETLPRISSGFTELDQVLGGGLVAGMVILLGGDPGIGKSTILLQSVAKISADFPVLYITGEESLTQIKLRAERIQLHTEQLTLLTETQIEVILTTANASKPRVLIIDSIQTMITNDVPSAAGSITQVREATARLVRFAKQTGTILFLIGHVTKDGQIAGPRVLEHMVDTVLYFEGERDNRYRIIRAVKNRFGAVGEIGVFVMTEKGLKGVNNPSAIFLSKSAPQTGGVVMVTWEGTRSLLVEIQALVDESHAANPRRVILGFDPNRLSLMLAVLNRHGGIHTYNQDVFINIVGGIRITETAIDLPVLLAVTSSLRNKIFTHGTVVFGEVGLSGEVRPVQFGQERLKEAQKLGFKRAIIPKENFVKNHQLELEILPVAHIKEALDCW